MDYVPITKPALDQIAVRPNLDDYAARRASHDWAAVRAELEGLPGGRGLNLAHEAIDRHANGAGAKTVAMRWISPDHEATDYTYADMKRTSNRFANVLGGLGIQKADRVFVFMDRTPELYAAVFGTLKNRSIIGPLFSAFGPEPVRDRLQHSRASVLVTTPTLYKKVEQIPRRPAGPPARHRLRARRRRPGDPPARARSTRSWGRPRTTSTSRPPTLRTGR